MKKLYFFIYSKNKELQRKFLSVAKELGVLRIIFPSQRELYQPLWPGIDSLVEDLKSQQPCSLVGIPPEEWMDDVHSKRLVNLWGTIAAQDAGQHADTVCVILPESMAGYLSVDAPDLFGKKIRWEKDTLQAGPPDMAMFDMTELFPHEREIPLSDKTSVAA